MATIPEAEASYQVAGLIKRHPRLSNLLFKLQGEGAGWITVLEKLEQALVEKPDA